MSLWSDHTRGDTRNLLYLSLVYAGVPAAVCQALGGTSTTPRAGATVGVSCGCGVGVMCFSSGYTLGLGVGACPVGSLVGAYRLVHPGDGGYPVGTPVGDGYPIGADVGRYGSPDGAVVANVLVGRGTGCSDG